MRNTMKKYLMQFYIYQLSSLSRLSLADSIFIPDLSKVVYEDGWKISNRKVSLVKRMRAYQFF
jgi:hypothetical protein